MLGFKRLSPLVTIYFIWFFFTLHAALPVFVSSTFLGTLTSEKYIGLIFTLASALGMLALIVVPFILRLIGDYYATVFFIILQILAFIGIAAFKNPLAVIVLFVVSSALVTLISFDFDLIVEKYSNNASTGSIRGFYLTFANIAWVVAPALAAILLGADQYWRVYLFASLLFVPGLLIFANKLEHFQDPLYRRIHFKQGLVTAWRRKDLRNIFAVSFLLQFFFTIMVIYTPIHLHENLGMPWEKLGPIFSVMLLPFLLLESWLGKVADRLIGEKELLVVGFSIIALATASVSFFTGQSAIVWAGILFMTRVGAAIIEIMSETYFFKKIDGEDSQIVSLQRTIRPFAGLLGPLVASAFLLFFPLQPIFAALGIIMLLGIPFSLAIKDTR